MTGKVKSKVNLEICKALLNAIAFSKMLRYGNTQLYLQTCRLCGTVIEHRSFAGKLSLSSARPVADGWPLMWVTIHYRSTNQANSACHPFGIDKWAVSCNSMSAASLRGSAIWWMLMKETQAWCLPFAGKTVWSMSECFESMCAMCILKWHYINTLPFLSFPLPAFTPQPQSITITTVWLVLILLSHRG